MKIWQAIATGAAATVAVAVAIGFMTPGARADRSEKEVRDELRELRDDLRGTATRVNAHDVELKGFSRDLLYIIDALDEMRGISLDERKRRRGR